MDFMAGMVTQAKIRLDDPLIVLAGDFNQWKMEEPLSDFPDVVENAVGPTRGDRCIDRVFSNLPGVSVTGTLPPLETDVDGTAARNSDHKISFVQADIPRVQAFRSVSYTHLTLPTTPYV